MSKTKAFPQSFLSAVTDSLDKLSLDPALDMLAIELAGLRDRGGRLFVIGCGGGAAHASHAVADFRTLAKIEAYCPSDNAANLTALTNDLGWDKSYAAWLAASRIRPWDGLLVISVGGGDAERNVSPNIIQAVDLAKSIEAKVFGIVGRDGGYTAKMADVCVVIPCSQEAWTTPVVESIQAVVLHLLVTDPRVKKEKTKWELEAAK